LDKLQSKYKIGLLRTSQRQPVFKLGLSLRGTKQAYPARAAFYALLCNNILHTVLSKSKIILVEVMEIK